MNVHNLKAGQVIANYNSLCSILTIQPKTSDSKIAQLKELSLLCSYKKKGHKFMIEEVYEKRLEVTKSYKTNAVWVRRDVHELIINTFLTLIEQNKTPYLQHKDLIRLLNVYTEEHYLGLYCNNKTNTEIDYYDESYRTLKTGIKTCISSLRSHYKIHVKEVYKIRENGNINYSSDKQITYILEAYKRLKVTKNTNNYYELLNKELEKIFKELNVKEFKVINRGYLLYHNEITLKRIKLELPLPNYFGMSLSTILKNKIQKLAEDKYILYTDIRNRLGEVVTKEDKIEQYKEEFMALIEKNINSIGEIG